MKLKTKIFYKYYLWLVMSLFAITSCTQKDYDLSKLSNEISWNGKIALAIGSTSFTIEKILNHYDSLKFLNQNSDGLLYIVYQKDLVSFPSSDKITVPVQQEVKIPSIILPPAYDANGKASQQVSLTFPLSCNNTQQIDSIILKSMLINFAGSSNYTHNGLLIISFPSITKNGSALTDTANIPANSNSINTTTANKADGYKMTFNSTSPDSSILPVTISFVLTGGTPGSSVESGKTLDIKFKLENLTYHVLYGYIGRDTLLDVTDSVIFPYLNTTLTQNIEWKAPQITFSIKNSYFFPIQYSILNMQIHSYLTQQIYPVTFYNNSNIQNIALPPQLGQSAYDSLIFSPTTTDAFNYLLKSPKNFQFHLNAIANPNGSMVNGKHVFNATLDTSTVNTSVKLYIPVWFRSGGFGTTDTMNFDLSNLLPSSSDSIQNMLLRLSSKNGMPVDLNLQVYFTDSLYNVIDSLFKDKTQSHQIVKAGQVNNSGQVTSSTSLVKDIVFNQSQLQSLLKTKKLLIKISLNTASYDPVNGPFVQFYSTDQLSIHFDCEFQPKIIVRL
jgi:hypothetical protein